MSKSLITLIVVVSGWLGLQQCEKHRKSQPVRDSGSVFQMDKRGAKKAIASMQADWKQGAERFAAGDFDACHRSFETGLAHLSEYTFRYGDQEFEKGKSLRVRLAEHQTQWAAGLASRRAEVIQTFAHQADVTALAKLRQRLADPQFENLARELCAEISRVARTHAGVLVVELYEGHVIRRVMTDVVAQLRGPESNVYLLFGTAGDIASLGDLPYVGLVRTTTYENIVRYTQSALGGAGDGGVVGLVTDMQLLIEPDPYARKNFSVARTVCETPVLKLPERFEPGEFDEYTKDHRMKVVRTLSREVGQLEPFALRPDPEIGYCTLVRLPVLAAGAMPELTRDSEVAHDFGRRP